jgi:hypothetical protein
VVSARPATCRRRRPVRRGADPRRRLLLWRVGQRSYDPAAGPARSRDPGAKGYLGHRDADCERHRPLGVDHDGTIRFQLKPTLLISGVSTTEYAGTVKAAAALKAIPASLRQALASELQALGNTTIHFREWIDGQHHLRKMVVTENLNGDTIDTTINVTAVNQPVSITLRRPPVRACTTMA